MATSFSIAAGYEDESVVMAAPGQAVQEKITLGPGPDEMTFTIAGDVSSWVLNPAQTPSTQTRSFRLTTDSSWKIKVSSDTGGYLTECDTSTGQYVPGGKRLKMPMNISVSSSFGVPSYTGYKVDLRQGGTVVEGQSDVYEVEIPFTFEQGVSWEDETLQQGHTYSMMVTFTLSPGR